MDISVKDKIDVAGSRLVVLGLGRSGIGAARLARHADATVFISDSASGKGYGEILARLSEEGINGESGGHSRQVFTADLIIVSPGIPADSNIIKKILDYGIPVIGEIEFASWFTDHPIISVTGSNGKTTTVYALHHMFDGTQYKPCLAGNMGLSFSVAVLSDLKKKTENRIYILEISSFQMEFIQHFKPSIAVFLNITPDHLDRHGDMNSYVRAKLNMAGNLRENSDGEIVFNTDDALLHEQFSEMRNAVPFGFSSRTGSLYSVLKGSIVDGSGQEVLDVHETGLPGDHNISNLLAAATAASLKGIKNEKIVRTFQEFPGVPHRLESVGTINDVQFINDSKATNVDAVKVALKSFTSPIILLLGGLDKAGDFEKLIPHTHNIHAVLAFGKAQDKIAAALVDAVRLINCVSLKDAVVESKKLARPGDIVLLSPGCASFDEFSNFEERGEYFKKLVKQDDMK